MSQPRETVAVRHRWVRAQARVVTKALEMPGATLRLFYARRWSAVTICSELVPRLRPTAWPAHIGTARSMLAAALAKRKLEASTKMR